MADIKAAITNRGRAFLDDAAGTAEGDILVADKLVYDYCATDGANAGCVLAALLDLCKGDEGVNAEVGADVSEAIKLIWKAAETYCARHPAK